MDIEQDRPKLFTALAEWLSCVSALWLVRRFVHRKRLPLLVLSLVLLCLIQMFCGLVSDLLWLSGMAAAVGVMYLTVWHLSGTGKKEAFYLTLRGFMAAEFIAAFEWQLDYYFQVYSIYGIAASSVLCVFVYVVSFVLYSVIEYRCIPKFIHGSFQPVTDVQLIVTAGLVLFFFAFSNLSYISTKLPFTGSNARGIFNSRSLIDMAGMGALFGFNLARLEGIATRENLALRETVERQYSQYMVAQETRDTLNRKYHDLKHQLAALRANNTNAGDLIDELEKGLGDYENEFDTGSTVLDTILSEKATICREKEIEFIVMADGTLLGALPAMDICAIFGNAIDNAIEYEEKIADREKRRIKLEVSRRSFFTLILIENYFEGELDTDSALPRTTKAEKAYHGYGLSSIKHSAEQYDGAMTISGADNIFQLKLLIPGKE